MVLDYQQISSIQLTPLAIRYLKRISNKGFLGGKVAFSAYKKNPLQHRQDVCTLTALVKLGLVTSTNDVLSYSITKEGLAWLEFHKSREWKFWIPIIISTIALIVSIIALVHPK